MKQKVLKQAYLPDALTWELSQRYDYTISLFCLIQNCKPLPARSPW